MNNNRLFILTGILLSLLLTTTVFFIKQKVGLLTIYPYILFYTAIVLSGIFGGFISSIFATLFSTLFIYFALAPSYLHILSVIIFFLEGASIGFLVKKLKDTQSFIVKILESITDPLVVIDKNWQYIFVNKPAEILFHKKKREMLGKDVRKLFSGLPKNNPLYLKLVTTFKTSQHFHYVFYSKEIGKWLDANFYPSELGITILFFDIDSQKKMERELEKSQMNFKTLIDSNIIGVAVEDTQGNIHYANDVFLSIIGYSRKDLETKKLKRSKITPEDWKRKDNEVEKTLFEKGSIKPYEKEYIRKDGQRISVLKGAAVLNKSKKTSIVFVLDITDRKEMEKRKDDFISIASHELKTPITSIKGFTQLLLKQSVERGDDKTSSYLSRMIGQLNRLTYLINDILDVRKIQDGKLIMNKEFFDINSLLKDVIKEVNAISPLHHIRFQSNSNKTLLADYYRIYQASLNMITNAVKYSPPQSEIVVTVEQVNGKLVVSVKDHGIGIPPEKQKNIFNKFYRVEGKNRLSYPGLGLGLFITSEIIKRHKGKIWFKSPIEKIILPDGRTVSQGSIFSFELPILEKHS